jgi:DNA-binding MarR family transcriptional regulator
MPYRSGKNLYETEHSSFSFSLRWLTVAALMVASSLTSLAALFLLELSSYYGVIPGGLRLISGSLTPSILPEVAWLLTLMALIVWGLTGFSALWTRHVKSGWRKLGLDEQLFELFINMRGADTRFALLTKLTVPSDRAQLASQLGLDWKTVDRQIQIFCRYGLIQEQASYGNTKVYVLTALGTMLLSLLQELQKPA